MSAKVVHIARSLSFYLAQLAERQAAWEVAAEKHADAQSDTGRHILLRTLTRAVEHKEESAAQEEKHARIERDAALKILLREWSR